MNELDELNESNENPNVLEVIANMEEDDNLVGFEIKINGETVQWQDLTPEQQKTVVVLYWNGFDFFKQFLNTEE